MRLYAVQERTTGFEERPGVALPTRPTRYGASDGSVASVATPMAASVAKVVA